MLISVCSCKPGEPKTIPSDGNITDNSDDTTQDNNNNDDNEENKDEKKEPELMNGGVYTNEYLGFQLTFPDSWSGNYNVRMYNEEGIEISFYGESITSLGYSNQTDISYGLQMFYISTEFELRTWCEYSNEIEKVGTVSNTDFYKFTEINHDYRDILDIETYEGELKEALTEDEIEKMKRDYDRFGEMEKDIPEILKSFKSIKEKQDLPEDNITPLTGGVYKNEELGFEITFPESWAGYYIIQKIDDECYAVCFYGKSKWGRYYNEYTQRYGLELFQIETDVFNKNNPDYRFVKAKIKSGTNKNLEIYTQYGLTLLVISQYVPNYREIPEKEYSLMLEDSAKAGEMVKNETMKQIYASFKPL